jgi:hypothetical protein
METTADFREQARLLQEFGELVQSETFLGAAASIYALAEQVDYYQNEVERMDEWIDDYAYDSNGFKF